MRPNHIILSLTLLLVTARVSAQLVQETSAAQPHITAVAPVIVNCLEGTAPHLPYRLWVSYAGCAGEYRQVRWNNSSTAAEQQMAGLAAGSAGADYTVRGYVTGDNTTTQGYPVEARVHVYRGVCNTPDARPVAQPLPLADVTISGDNRLTRNRDLDTDHLLTLDVRQQLYNYRDTYGLPTDGYPVADGWDSPTTKLKGHGSGHYMSAMAMAYAGCSDAGKRQRIRDNLRIMVDELRRCQERTFVYDDSLGRYREARDLAPEAELRQLGGTWADFDRYKRDFAHYGYGYLNAIPAQHCVLIEMYRAYNNEQWVWAPYYSVHKQLAGLIDIATYVDDQAIADKALLIARDMGLWVWNRLHYRSHVDAGGTQEQRRARPGNRYEMWNMYIAGEVGGMAESLARLATMTADITASARLLEAATCFDSPAFMEPLKHNVDAIRTRHANQHIPMVTGALWAFRAGAGSDYYNLAHNFWTMVQGRYRYATGGVGNGEMFRQPYSQILSMCTNVGTDWHDQSTYPEPTLNETCCAYNLAKLTKDLNCYSPNDAAYMDYYERLLCNQLVGSVRPDDYAVLYQYAVGLNASKPWGNETPQSTCCGGTGAENHVKYQEATYFVAADTLWVAQYMPTRALWREHGAVVTQQCQWPAQRSVLRLAGSQRPLTVKLRVPYWATEGFDIRLNGHSVAANCQPSTYIHVGPRTWSAADSIEVIMPFTVHVDFGPDKMEVAATGRNQPQTRFAPLWCGAVMRGPLVMAAQDVTTWEQATLDIGEMANMTHCDTAAPDGGTPQLRTMLTAADGRRLTMLPDFEADSSVTHYFRLQMAGQPVQENIDSQQAADVSRLEEAMQTARARRDAQQAWQQMSVKVPEYAPWAPHGYGRMMQTYDDARALLDDGVRSQNQAEIDAMTTRLNADINTMRPGNLPELEDLQPLLPLLARAQATPNPSADLRQAVEYAEMVVRYVSDGSGTHDMIVRAIRQLETYNK